MSCYFVSSDRPRMVRGEHLESGCECKGCLPCAHSHCRICSLAHAAGTCPECMSETRDALHEIGRMCDALPEEVETRGVDGEAMMLLGPAADPEARGHLKASVNVGRVPEDYLEEADGELHPLFVLGTWDMLVRDVLEHDEPTERLTVELAIDYLDRQLSYLGGFEDLPFEDMARDLRKCANHLERVLHDGEQVETGAPCMTCRKPLRRVFAGNELPWTHRDGSKPRANEDVWACAKCHEWRDDERYRLNVSELHRTAAEWLTDQEMEVRTGIRAGTVREWARDRSDRPALVDKRRDSGRVVYLVADVERIAREKGMMAS